MFVCKGIRVSLTYVTAKDPYASTLDKAAIHGSAHHRFERRRVDTGRDACGFAA
jgi:hypothetical protein